MSDYLWVSLVVLIALAVATLVEVWILRRDRKREADQMRRHFE